MARTGGPAPPLVGVVVVPLTAGSDDLLVYVRKRQQVPHRGRLGLPETVLEPGEATEQAARRVLDAASGLPPAHLNQLYTFSNTRDPRGHTVDVAYTALFHTPHQRENPYPLEDAWLPMRRAIGTRLAFDHARILDSALTRLQGRLDYTRDAYRLLPPKFTIPQLQHIHEVVLGDPLKPDVFTKRALRNGLRSLQTRETAPNPSGGRPARLYRNPTLEASS